MTDEALKPCPFCEGETHLHYDPKTEMFGPVSEHARGCPIMNFDLVDYSDEHVAIAAWNTRALLAGPPEPSDEAPVAWRVKIGRGSYGYSEREEDADWHIRQANVDTRLTPVEKTPLYRSRR